MEIIHETTPITTTKKSPTSTAIESPRQVSYSKTRTTPSLESPRTGKQVDVTSKSLVSDNSKKNGGVTAVKEPVKRNITPGNRDNSLKFVNKSVANNKDLKANMLQQQSVKSQQLNATNNSKTAKVTNSAGTIKTTGNDDKQQQQSMTSTATKPPVVRKDSKNKMSAQEVVKTKEQNNNNMTSSKPELLKRDSLKNVISKGDQTQDRLSQSVVDFSHPSHITNLSTSLPNSSFVNNAHLQAPDVDVTSPSTETLPPITVQQCDVTQQRVTSPDSGNESQSALGPRKVGKITKQLKMQSGFPALIIQRESSVGNQNKAGGSRRSSAHKAGAHRRTSGKHGGGGSRRSAKRMLMGLGVGELSGEQRPSTRDSLLSVPYDPSFDYYSDDFVSDFDSDSDISEGFLLLIKILFVYVFNGNMGSYLKTWKYRKRSTPPLDEATTETIQQTTVLKHHNKT